MNSDSTSTAMNSECTASWSEEGYLNLIKIAAITLVRLRDGH